jgi:hypothetical protein
MKTTAAADWLDQNFCDYIFAEDPRANAEILKQLEARLVGLDKGRFLDEVIAFFTERGEMRGHDGIADMKIAQRQSQLDEIEVLNDTDV